MGGLPPLCYYFFKITTAKIVNLSNSKGIRYSNFFSLFTSFYRKSRANKHHPIASATSPAYTTPIPITVSGYSPSQPLNLQCRRDNERLELTGWRLGIEPHNFDQRCGQSDFQFKPRLAIPVQRFVSRLVGLQDITEIVHQLHTVFYVVLSSLQ